MIQYAKHNRILLKSDNRESSIKIILEFFKKVQGLKSNMKGFIVMNSIEDPSESIVITFWENKKDMDNFYHSNNQILSHLVEKLEPSFEAIPERRGYQISDYKII